MAPLYKGPPKRILNVENYPYVAEIAHYGRAARSIRQRRVGLPVVSRAVSALLPAAPTLNGRIGIRSLSCCRSHELRRVVGSISGCTPKLNRGIEASIRHLLYVLVFPSSRRFDSELTGPQGPDSNSKPPTPNF